MLEGNFSSLIIKWYEKSKRDLPWRRTRDPYLIWISEIMLQQTRVDQALDYYHSFTERFPSMESLALAGEEEVLKHWQGLGYYSRARNLHAAARQVMAEYGGVFPDNIMDIRKLRGIGKYTAAAVASIAFGRPVPVVDGNVCRVIARFCGIHAAVNTPTGEKEVYERSLAFLDPAQPGTYNQAVMEFGAIYCKPLTPGCPGCVLREGCHASRHQLTGTLPVKITKHPPQDRYFNYLVITDESPDDGRVLMRKREENDIWKNLYDFPLAETCQPATADELKSDRQVAQAMAGTSFIVSPAPLSIRHVLTHRVIHAFFWEIRTRESSGIDQAFRAFWISWEDIPKLPVSRLLEKFLEASGKIFQKK